MGNSKVSCSSFSKFVVILTAAIVIITCLLLFQTQIKFASAPSTFDKSPENTIVSISENSASLQPNSSNVSQWSSYEDIGLGVKYEYPKNWSIKEITYPFRDTPVINLQNENEKFIAQKFDLADEKLTEFVSGYAETNNEIGIKVKNIEFDKYMIDGESAESFISERKNDSGVEITSVDVFAEHNAQGYSFTFDNLKSSFYDKEFQQTIGRIINSITFLN